MLLQYPRFTYSMELLIGLSLQLFQTGQWVGYRAQIRSFDSRYRYSYSCFTSLLQRQNFRRDPRTLAGRTGERGREKDIVRLERGRYTVASFTLNNDSCSRRRRTSSSSSWVRRRSASNARRRLLMYSWLTSTMSVPSWPETIIDQEKVNRAFVICRFTQYCSLGLCQQSYSKSFTLAYQVVGRAFFICGVSSTMPKKSPRLNPLW